MVYSRSPTPLSTPLDVKEEGVEGRGRREDWGRGRGIGGGGRRAGWGDRGERKGKGERVRRVTVQLHILEIQVRDANAMLEVFVAVLGMSAAHCNSISCTNGVVMSFI